MGGGRTEAAIAAQQATDLMLHTLLSTVRRLVHGSKNEECVVIGPFSQVVLGESDV